MRDFFHHGRPAAAGLRCAVTSSHGLASTVALQVLSQGGNATDAAVAASFVLCVVEPQSTGLGGDCFALLMTPGMAEPVAFNGSGRSPRALDPEAAARQGGSPLAEASVHAVTVPGLVEGLCRLLERHGSWPLARVLEPAIFYAENGFPVTDRVAEEWAFVSSKLALRPASKATFLPGGKAPAAGTVIAQTALAETLRRIAQKGSAAFYEGRLAEAMVACLKAEGGYHAVDDFALHRGAFVAPIHQCFFGHQVWQVPPNGQGVMAVMMLHLLADGPAANAMQAPWHIALNKAARAAFNARDRYVADPEHGAVPLALFTDREQALAFASSLAGTAVSPAPAASGDTAYVGVIDEDGQAVSLISSLFEGFGSGVFDPETGVMFHNRGSGFAPPGDHPNALAPGKRPLHTIMPGLATRDGAPSMCFGVTGGPYQAIGQTQLLSQVLGKKTDVQRAIEAPRSFLCDGRVQLEPAIGALSDALEAEGFRTIPAERPVGGAHAIMIDPGSGFISAGSDPRKDGAALAL